MPLSDIRVLDLTNVLAGPYCCHQLAHMGAEVIKIEVPGTGDLARQLGASESLNQKYMGISYLAQNAGKKSITLNLKSEKGKAIFRELVKTADVIVENFRPGVMKRLQLDYPILKEINEQIIYCAISGFGADGDMHKRPAYDQIIQGMSGIMSVTGTEDTGPLRAGYPAADTVGGLTGAFAIVSACAGRSNSGKGCFIDVSMLESVISSMGWIVSNFLIEGKTPKQFGNDNMTSSPSGAFKTLDGMINIAANKQEQFESVCELLAKPEWLLGEQFSTRQSRIENRVELNWKIEQVLTTQVTEYWVERFNELGVPAGPVLTIPQVLETSQIKNRNLTKKYKSVEGVDRDIEIVTTGFQVNGQRPSLKNPPPTLGQDTDAVLEQLGYSDQEIQKFYKDGVL
jgi:crotonobetainyl-CoA:carnitine CoA-transferase CaiB-like acyl-CoA transferase